MSEHEHELEQGVASAESTPEAGCAKTGLCDCCPASEEDSLGRRAFMAVGGTVVAAGYAAAFGYPLYKYLAAAADKAAIEASVKEIELKDADKLPSNAAMVFKFGGRPALLIHHADDTWAALTAVCTHLGCTVAYDPGSASIKCACHGGVYDAKTGANVSGPPPKPLTQLKADVSAGKVVVSRV